MNWLVFHLIGDVLTHYWYGEQCKLYDFVKNRKLKEIGTGAILSARKIPINFIFMYPNEKDVAFVISINNYPVVGTVSCPNSIWAFCDCPICRNPC